MKLVFPLYINKSLSTYQNKFVGFFFFFFWVTPLSLWDLSSLTRVNRGPWQWKLRILTTGLPGNFWVVETLILPIMYFSIQYFRYFKYSSRNNLQARNPGVEILLSTEVVTAHPPSAPPLGAVLSVRDGSPFLPSWYLSHRKCYKGFFKKGNMEGWKYWP